VLELGPAEGLMTDILYPIYSKDYTIVDGSELFVKKIKEKYPSINAFFSTFEEFCPSHKFDNIILGHVLEHVIDPIAILKLCKTWLTKAGKVLAAVPNKNSIHRQAGVKMGLLKSLDDFSDKDKRHGHRRVFGMENFLGCFKEAAFCIEAKGGYWLKPISDAQINQYWTQEMIRAFLILGEELPDIAGEIYCIATN
jgi:2-polyprenyl-3-methyl-5-hydroxy-6-metoxy-1,4-benzoquinol methylase